MASYIEASMLKRMFKSGAANLQNNKDYIDKLNVFPVPDGDTGTNLSLTMSYAIRDLDKVGDMSVTSVSKAISKGSLMGARGNSGVILSQIFRGFSQAVDGKEKLGTEDFAKAIKKGAEVSYKAVIKPIEGTILTVVRETGDFAIKLAKKEKDMEQFLVQIVEYARESVERTPDQLQALKDAGVVDSGAKGLVTIYEGMLAAYKGNDIKHEQVQTTTQSTPQATGAASVNEDIKFGYCTEFIIDTNEDNKDKIKDFMLKIGDSLAVVGDDGLVKVHVHTSDPGEAISEALKYGQLLTVKIENMRFQHENIVLEQGNEGHEGKSTHSEHSYASFENDENIESSAVSSKAIEEPAEKKKYGFIATSIGDGLNKIFEDLGIDYIIAGGQTMNPSTEDFLAGIKKINAENIIILPNNGNIIMAANQAKGISEGNIAVIPTKNIPHGFSAMLAFDPELDLEENAENMTEILEDVKAGEVTFAVRDTSMNGVDIKEGNIIGIAQKEIKVVGDDVTKTTFDLIDSLVDEDDSLISIYYGEDVKEDEADALRAMLEEKYADLDVEMFYGGQPLYYYLISIE